MDLNRIFVLFQDKFIHTVKIRRFGKIDIFLILGFVAVFMCLFKFPDSAISLSAIFYIYIYYERIDFLISESIKDISSAISAIFWGIISIAGILSFGVWFFLIYKLPLHWSFAELIIFAYPVFSASSKVLKNAVNCIRHLK